MFFGYPIKAVADNWLHDCLVEMVTSIHTKLDAGAEPIEWPLCIPVAGRPKLKTRTGLRDRLEKYRISINGLKPYERAQVLRCLTEQNKIGELVSCRSDCESIADLPKSIRIPAEDLFAFAFGLLTDLGIRDKHYKEIYEATDYHICPFCGCEPFDAPVDPGARKRKETRYIGEDLDHYLPKNQYPFAAVNLYNLAPMGGRCNGYKLNQDLLRDSFGVRRKSFYPYSHISTKISLLNSTPFGGQNGTPSWIIEFHPAIQECETWDSVFYLQQRWTKDVLDPHFKTWIRDFALWFRSEYGEVKITKSKILTALDRYAKNEAIRGMYGRDFFRALVFRMLHHHCLNRDARLLALLDDALTQSVPPGKALRVKTR